MSQKFPGKGYKQVDDLPEVNKNSIKSYNEKNNEGHFLGDDILHIRNLKQALNHGLVLKKIQ